MTIRGFDEGDRSGTSVNGAGDVNGDGYDDLLIGAADSNSLGNGRALAGESYVVLGGPGLPEVIDLADSGWGFPMFGVDGLDRSGGAVSTAGDIDGDGFDDLLIGARDADAAGNAKESAGESVVVYGRNFSFAVTHGGTSGADRLLGDQPPT